MPALTPAERRGGTMLVFLLLLGTGYDLWREHFPQAPPAEPPPVPAPAESLVAASRDSASTAVDNGPVEPRLDLNRASAAELDALPGIGPVLAARIVEHRRLHGRFRRIEELRAVRGVGPRLYERLSPRLRAGP